MYPLRGARCAGLNDVKCQYKRMCSPDQQNIVHNKRKESGVEPANGFPLTADSWRGWSESLDQVRR